MTKIEVLKLLADGEFHSGQELADLVGVSRTAVWKQLGKVSELGIKVESVKGRGYRLVGGLQLLEEGLIRSNLSEETVALLTELQLPGVIDSTNTVALNRILDGSAQGFVCCAEQQTAGRGRRGRTWVSPYGSNIYMSVTWTFEDGAAALEGLSLAIGVAVCEALEELGLLELKLKWPNDVLFKGRKLAGILLEMVGDAAGPCQVVVGLGVNLKMPAKSGQEINQEWTDITNVPGGKKIDRNKLQAALLNSLLPALQRFKSKGFSSFRERWVMRDAFVGQSVVVIIGERKISGHALGVDEHGALLLGTAEGVKKFNGGEVSLRVEK